MIKRVPLAPAEIALASRLPGEKIIETNGSSLHWHQFALACGRSIVIIRIFMLSSSVSKFPSTECTHSRAPGTRVRQAHTRMALTVD